MAIYRLFKDGPAWHSDYINVCNNKFPLNCSAKLLLENVSVTETALEVFDNEKKFV